MFVLWLSWTGSEKLLGKSSNIGNEWPSVLTIDLSSDITESLENKK